MKKIIAGLVGTVMGLTMVFASACGNRENDPETRALSLAIGALDKNFNPFYATSLNDNQVISETQVSLISVGTDSQPKVGEDVPTVAKDFTTTVASDNSTTTYEFLIKNGMKFSDGEPLTIKDVLFNFYVYLDPAYTGSTTMYSVDIQGLKAYQANDATIRDDQDVETTEYYRQMAQQRLNYLINWSDGEGDSTLSAQGQKDLETIKDMFKEELESDWTAIETSWSETYKDEFHFTAAWQAYLYQENVVSIQRKRNTDGSYTELKDADGKNYTTLDEWQQGADGAGSHVGMVELQQVITDVEAATSSDKVQAYITAHPGATEDYAKLQLSKEAVIDYIYATYTDKSQIGFVIQAWATGTNALIQFTAEERIDAIKNNPNPQPNISGITTRTTTTFNGKELGESHDVLKIVINGVDPAAIWNFGVSIAPMHYYSGTWGGKNYIEAFNGTTEFGVERGNINFFNEVVKNPDKIALPMGAGAYKASTINGGNATSGSDFDSNNIVYYERNENFESMGAELENAKIKYLKYKVLEDDRILPSLKTGDIDYGEPNAIPANVDEVNANNDTLGSEKYFTNGFGYVGINPKFVPDITVRRAIMSALDTRTVVSYYGSDNASVLYRPMSATQEWVYTYGYGKTATQVEDAYPVKDLNDIKAELNAAGYQEKGGVLTRGDEKLEYTFTIAGASTEHPAYQMFKDAERRLNSIGFKITVQNDAQALKKMAGGQLAVWAAAWSAGIDPDMYQVYHKDSNATSVYNWGYPEILNDTAGKYTTEKGYIDDMAEYIDAARKTLDQRTRAENYQKALDLVMDLAVELPTYQRKDLCVYNKKVIDAKSLNPTPTANLGLIAEIWKVDYVK